VSERTEIRVLIVDDHVVLRKGIAFSLLAFENIEVVAEASTGEQAILLCQALTPDVVLMDVHMPGMGGIVATRVVRDTCPHTQVIALDGFEEGRLVQETILAGAIGCLLKDAPAEELVRAIHQAHHGTPVMAPGAAQALVRQVQARSPQIGHDLTQRERDVLGLVTEGRSNEAIAERLVITPATVKFHVHRIRIKLGTANRTQMAVLALQHQLVDPAAGAATGRGESRTAYPQA
jgi:NarL family two-component system response regulator LiaR